MPYRSITLSEEAYRALDRMKQGKESFTDLVLRLSRRNNARELLDVLGRLGPDEGLSGSVERVYRLRGRVRPREVEL